MFWEMGVAVRKRRRCENDGAARKRQKIKAWLFSPLTEISFFSFFFLSFFFCFFLWRYHRLRGGKKAKIVIRSISIFTHSFFFFIREKVTEKGRHFQTIVRQKRELGRQKRWLKATNRWTDTNSAWRMHCDIKQPKNAVPKLIDQPTNLTLIHTSSMVDEWILRSNERTSKLHSPCVPITGCFGPQRLKGYVKSRFEDWSIPRQSRFVGLMHGANCWKRGRMGRTRKYTGERKEKTV